MSHQFKLSTSFLKLFQPAHHSPRRVDQIGLKPAKITATKSVSDCNRYSQRQKIAVIMGPTGAGKSRLSTELATQFFENCEIINCDKMQVYSGLDITTNKITMQERLGVPHHLLGSIDPRGPALTPSDFRELASEIISDVDSRGGFPVVVGGSNSLIYSLTTDRYDPGLDVFNGPDACPVSSELRYDCCFIWVDVCSDVLNRYLSKRVDVMLDSGMFEELEEFFRSGEHNRVNRSGLGKAIGIREFENYFKEFPGFHRPLDVKGEMELEAYNGAVRKIKDNTCQLAKKQVSKILRLRNAGWRLNRIDATEVFRAVMAADSDRTRVTEIWEKLVLEPSIRVVKQSL